MRPTQMSLLGPLPPAMMISLDPDHMMVRLTHLIDWDFLQILAEERRSMSKGPRGPKPHYRANLGAVIVRVMKSCDLRTAADLVRNYMPARYLCDLHNSDWTPEFNTIWDFEAMLGEEGLKEINDYILRVAVQSGFADIKGLCADTTVQEARIPYPNEVGLMASFAKSVGRSLQTLETKAHGALVKTANRVKEKLKEVAKEVRKHRLFAKTKEARNKVARTSAQLTQAALHELFDLLQALGEMPHRVRGAKKRAANHLSENAATMSMLLPQIEKWLSTNRVAPEKIVSLFLSEVRAIVRGKIGKQVEFGFKWGVNQIRGGYISIYMMAPMKAHDAEFAVEAIREHKRLFDKAPREFGFDRGAWSEEHIEKIKNEGVQRVAIAPKGKAQWRVSDACAKRMVNERAQVEGKIGTIKTYGFNKPKARTTTGMRRAAQRASLRFNVTKLLKDIAATAQIPAMRAT